MEQAEIERVAKGLSKAQRAVLDEVADAGVNGLGFGRSALFMRKRLIQMGLTERIPNISGALVVARERLSDLGLAVRRHLKDQPHDQ